MNMGYTELFGPDHQINPAAGNHRRERVSKRHISMLTSEIADLKKNLADLKAAHAH
jgi:hypothetical protein